MQDKFRNKRPDSTARGYNHKWEKLARQYRLNNPWCAMCLENGRHEPAMVVDHIVPHNGDKGLFWSQDNWQGLCVRHHNSHKAFEEIRGVKKGANLDGTPKDPRHPFYRKTNG